MSILVSGKQVSSIHGAIAMRADCRQMELDIVHLRALVESNFVEFTLTGHSLLDKLLNYHVCDTLESAVVLVLLDINVDNSALGRVVVLHSLQTAQSKLNRLWVLTTCSSKQLLKNIALEALKHSLCSIEANLILEVEHKECEMQSRSISELASLDTELLFTEDSRLELFIIAQNDCVSDWHRYEMREVNFFARLLLTVLILVITAV